VTQSHLPYRWEAFRIKRTASERSGHGLPHRPSLQA
jgi:hypothetical protein